MLGDEQAQRSGISEEAVPIYRRDDSVDLNIKNSVSNSLAVLEDPRQRQTYHFAFERPPHDGSIAHSELSQPATGKNATLRDVKGIHDGDDVIVASAGSLDILDQLCRDQLVHVAAEI